MSGFVWYPSNPVASCEFQPESSTAAYAFMENLFAKDFPGPFTTYGNSLNMLVDIVRSSFTGRGNPWIVQLHIFANQKKTTVLTTRRQITLNRIRIIKLSSCAFFCG